MLKWDLQNIEMDTPRTEKGLDTELVLQEQNKETSGPENAEDTSKL